MTNYTIKTATADYTGGGIYIYYGELENGLYFRTADEWQSISICDADTSTEDADYSEFFELHQIDELQNEDYKRFFNNMLVWINNNRPSGNYNIGELEQRVILNEPQQTTREQIEELENKLRKLKRIDELESFLNHMQTTFNNLMGDDCTSETVDRFYNMPFTISFNGKTIRIDNGADAFQEIESTIERELDEITE